AALRPPTGFTSSNTTVPGSSGAAATRFACSLAESTTGPATSRTGRRGAFYLGGKETDIVGRTGEPARHSGAIDVSDVATMVTVAALNATKAMTCTAVSKRSFMRGRDGSTISVARGVAGGPAARPRGANGRRALIPRKTIPIQSMQKRARLRSRKAA